MTVLFYRNGVPVTADDCKHVVDIGRTAAMRKLHEKQMTASRESRGSSQSSGSHYHGDPRKLRKHARQV
jgi:hypothetical protein